MGILYLVATPIGNLEDITLRALRILKEVDLIACEDTRKTGLLLKRLNITNKKLISFYEYNEEKRVEKLTKLLISGSKIALVSNAGMPLISDPGFELVRQCLEKNIKIEAIPGPSSVITALVSSGLPPDKFLFLGFLPKKQSKRKKLLKSVKKIEFSITIIIFESPYRVKKLLNEIQEIYGDIQVVIANELTKKFEKFLRGKVSQLKKIIEKNPLKGEITFLFRFPPK